MRNLVTTATGLKIGLAYIPASTQEYGRDALWLQRLLIDKPKRTWLFERARKFGGSLLARGR